MRTIARVVKAGGATVGSRHQLFEMRKQAQGGQDNSAGREGGWRDHEQPSLVFRNEGAGVGGTG